MEKLPALFFGMLIGAIAGAGILGVGYANPPYIQTYSARFSADDQTLKDILAELRAIRLELAAQRKLQAARVPEEPLPRTLHQAMTAFRCATCHTEDKLVGKNNDLVLVTKENKVPPFSTTEKRLILGAIKRGDMPMGIQGQPPFTLSDSQKQRFEDLINGKEIDP